MKHENIDPNSTELLGDWQRKREALQSIAERCEAINFPPDLVVDLLTLARGALAESPR